MSLGPLHGYRAIDITESGTALCGSILGGLGVDVIKVESPYGDPARNVGPFYHDKRDLEGSLHWLAHNINKRGITLDIRPSKGRVLLRRLAEKADFLIESFAPGHLDSLELGYQSLSRLNPRLVMTSITPFGQTGPHRNLEACDIVIMAMSGIMYSTGDPDRAPVRISFPQAQLQAAAHAAAATLIAFYHRQMSGEGQHIDVSMQESVCMATLLELAYWQFAHTNSPRVGPYIHRGGILLRELYPCKDGAVSFRLVGGKFGRGAQPLIDWMTEEGMAGALNGVNLADMDISSVTQEMEEEWEESFCNFFSKHTADEIAREALKRHIHLMPASNTRQIVEHPQLQARDFWANVEHPELGATLRYPGGPYKFSATPWQVYRRPPKLGEHNEEVYRQELGLTKDELDSLRESGVVWEATGGGRPA